MYSQQKKSGKITRKQDKLPQVMVITKLKIHNKISKAWTFHKYSLINLLLVAQLVNTSQKIIVNFVDCTMVTFHLHNITHV